MSSARFPIPQGTLDMLILHVLSLEAAHGYAIAQRLQQISRDTVQVNQGSLYPALHRLEQKRWLKLSGGARNSRDAVRAHAGGPGSWRVVRRADQLTVHRRSCSGA
jgi:DNA-binding PadR family transcriptional regulator